MEVHEGVEADAARDANAGFLLRLTAGRPWLTLKLALTLDGRIATASGESRWITGARRAARCTRCAPAMTRFWSAAGTARADDPDLRVRDLGIARHPVRVVASRAGPGPGGTLGATARATPVWLVHEAGRQVPQDWSATGAKLIGCDVTDDALNPRAMMETLAREGLTRVLCEGGGALGASLIAADMVDELVIFGAGKVIGADGHAGWANWGWTRLADAPQFKLCHLQRLGEDICQIWRRR